MTRRRVRLRLLHKQPEAKHAEREFLMVIETLNVFQVLNPTNEI